MKPETIHTVVFSPTGTSKKIAAAVARAIASATGTAASVPLKTIDLTHSAGQPATLPADTVAGLASRQGFVPVAAGAFVGEHSYSTPETPVAAGRPDTQDLAEAEAFGAAVREKLAAGNLTPVDAAGLKDVRTPLLPMLRFIRFVLGYRRRQRKNPVVYLPAGNADLCTRCGRCAAICPTQAIARGDETHTDPARCIRCCACVKGCPVGARSFHTPFAAALARNFARRKPPVTRL